MEGRWEQIGGFAACFHDTLSSTQVTSRQTVDNGTAQDGQVVITAEQTAGYGRRGRSWHHQTGNVYLTLTRFFSDADKHLLPHYGFITSLAIAETCRHFLYGTMARVILKWPNDVLVNDAKIAGILLEKIDTTERTVLLLGVGINVITPQNVDQQVAALDQFMPHPLAARDVIPVFLHHLARYEDDLRQNGFPAIRHLWLQQAKGQGQPVAARLANGTVLEGLFLDLDNQGALLLQIGDTLKTVTSADIFFTV